MAIPSKNVGQPALVINSTGPIKSQTSPLPVQVSRPPTVEDRYPITQQWFDKSNNDLWILVNYGNTGLPIWELITSSSAGLTEHALAVGDASNQISSLPLPQDYEILQGNFGADPSWEGTPRVLTITAVGADANGSGFIASDSDIYIGNIDIGNPGPIVGFYKSQDGSSVNQNNILGSLDFKGAYAVNTYTAGAQIEAVVTGTVFANNRMGSILTFSTCNNAGGGIQPRMTIGNNGAVTINNPDSGTGLTIAGSGLTSTGTTTLSSLNNFGVMQTNASGVVSSTNGTNGQVLIASTGAAPAWGTITSSDNSITVTTGANTINLTVPGGANGLAFSYYQASDSGSITSGTVTSLGASVALTSIFDNSAGAFSPGNGIGTSAVFTAIVAGVYFFKVSAKITTSANSAVSATIVTPGQSFNNTLTYVPGFSGIWPCVDAIIPLNVGQQVTFTVVSASNNFVIKGSATADTYVFGYRIA